MSFTTKKISGTEYEYFEFYLNGKKKTVLLGRRGEIHSESSRKIVLRVLKDKLFTFAKKLWQYYGKFQSPLLCQNSFHGDEIEMKALFEYFLKAIKHEDIKKRERLPLITIVYKDKTGIRQVTDLCIDCLFRKLHHYGSFDYKRKPKRLGVLFLDKDVNITI